MCNYIERKITIEYRINRALNAEAWKEEEAIWKEY
jgi:hypothetical protein